MHPCGSWIGISKWAHPKTNLISSLSTSASSQSFPSQSVVTSFSQWPRPKFLEEKSLSLLFLSHTPFDLSVILVLCIFKTFSYCDPLSLPSLPLSRSKPLSALACLLQWHSTYPSWSSLSLYSLCSQRYPFTNYWIKSFFCWGPFSSFLSYSEGKVGFKMA